MDPQQAGYGFEEDLADLMELNGYKVNKTARSNDGGVDIIATKADEVGHEISYIIQCKKLNNPIDRAEIDKILGVQKKFPGSIAVVASDSSGFTRGACEMAETFGVRFWGEVEIENLRRNIRQKRGRVQKEAVESEKGQYPIRGGPSPKKKRSKIKFVVFLVILAILFAYIILIGPDSTRDLPDLLEKQIRFHRSWGSVQSDLFDIYKAGHNQLEGQLKGIMGGGMEISKAYVSQIWGRLVEIC